MKFPLDPTQLESEWGYDQAVRDGSMKRQLALMLMVVALLLTACSANDTGARFRNPDYGYSVQVPRGWREDRKASGTKARVFTRPAGSRGDWVSNAYLVDGSRHVLISLRLPADSPLDSYLATFRSFVASYRR